MFRDESEIRSEYDILPSLDESILQPSVSGEGRLKSFEVLFLKYAREISPKDISESDNKIIQRLFSDDGSFKDKVSKITSQAVDHKIALFFYFSVLEKMQEGFGDLSFWRGGSYEPTNLSGDFALSLPIALQHIFRYSSAAGSVAGQERDMPCLIKVPINAILSSMREGLHVVSGLSGGLENAQTAITLRFSDLGFKNRGIQFYKPPSGSLEFKRNFIIGLSKKAETL